MGAVRPDDPSPRSRDAVARRGAPAFLPSGHPQGYADCFDAFVADFYSGVRSGSAVDGMPTFSDGLRAALITDAVLASSREERWVDVAESEASGGDVKLGFLTSYA